MINRKIATVGIVAIGNHLKEPCLPGTIAENGTL